jgi:short-subunit dehydrogenase
MNHRNPMRSSTAGPAERLNRDEECLMAQRPKVRRVVITGASSGIGRATAEAFARQGARLVLAARDPVALEEVASHCRNLGSEVLTMPVDVGDALAVRHLALAAKKFGHGIDMWFSNVGVGAVGRFTEVPIDAHERIIRSNLLGHVNDAHAVLPIFQAQGHGIFVNMISLGGFAASPFAAAYSASKFGLRGFSEALRAELSDFADIHICDVYPSFVDTPALRHAGNYTGKKLRAPPPLLDARRVADAVVRLATRPRRTVILGSPSWAARLAHFVSPSLTAWSAKVSFERYFASADRAPITSGNLFAPPSDGTDIDGGLRRSNSRQTTKAAVALAVISCGVAGAWAGKRLQKPPLSD